jgi:uncharacterized protein (TIGR02679 family)
MSAATLDPYLTRPELRRLWQAARAAYERTGGRVNGNGKLAGRLRVPAVTAEEAFAISGLVGHRIRNHPRAGEPFTVALATLDEVLAQDTEFPALREVLELLGGPLDLIPQRRAAEADAEERFWRGYLSHPACRDPRVAEWVEILRWSSLASWARRHDGRSLTLALDAAGRIAQHTPIELVTLASAMGGDPHCLDHGRTAGTLLLSLLAYRDGVQLPASAVERRALLLRCGVMPDLLSSDVLCVGLPATGDGPAGRMLAVMTGRHVRLTYAHLAEQRLQFPAGLVVHTCENPVLVARAEQLPTPPPLVCTGGQRTTAVALLLDMLTDNGAEIRHHGDFDAGGLAIAALMAREHGARPWRYDAGAYQQALSGLPGRAPTLSAERLAGFADGPFGELARMVQDRGVAVYEEDVLPDLLGDLAEAGAIAGGR